MTCYDRVIEIQPRAADALNRKGVLLEHADNLPAAFSCYKRATAADEKNTRAWNNLARLFYQMGELENALACCKKVLNIDPEDDSARTGMEIILDALD
jgi:tetratricopeptide (TPR) repeat protein